MKLSTRFTLMDVFYVMAVLTVIAAAVGIPLWRGHRAAQVCEERGGRMRVVAVDAHGMRVKACFDADGKPVLLD